MCVRIMHPRVAPSKLARFGKEDVVEQFADVFVFLTLTGQYQVEC